MSRLCIDLCSGLGGLSAAFVDAGWNVVRIDNDPKFLKVPFTSLGDVTSLREVREVIELNGGPFINLDSMCVEQQDERTIDAILMSPPCSRFSLACRTWPKPGIQNAMEIVGACLEVVARYRPKFWLLENPKARLRWFVGTPKGTIKLSDYGAKYLKPTDYWGNVELPLLMNTVAPKMYLRPMKHDLKAPSPIYLSGADAAKRAEMPYGLSQAILEAVA